MKLQNNSEINKKTSHERLSEIGHILAKSIIRLKSREDTRNGQNQLDSNLYPSVHGVSDNLNSRAL